MGERLAGKVAIITGSGSGLGRASAMCMASEGATVIINDVNLANARAVASEIKAKKGKALAIKADVTKPAQVKRMVDKVLKRFGQIDILMNNAGTGGKTDSKSKLGPPLTNILEEDWDFTFAVNVRGMFTCCKAVMDHMKSRRYGRIINVSSTAGKRPSVLIPAYSASKGAVITFTQVLSQELAPQGITVNAICPGIIWTPMWQEFARRQTEQNPRLKGMEPKAAFDAIVTMAAGGVARAEQQPEDIGWLAVFLASDEAKRISGEAISVDGPTPAWESNK
jgi:NAD(P)-dependent dehydrogenase (short-subunit alcohol dehydrogenase family)